MSVLAVDRLTKSFGGFTAVDDVSIVVDQGEMRGLIGSNGAGKSTLLHLVYGRITPDHGSTRFGDTDVTHLPVTERARLGMGLVFQVTSVFDGLTVEENLLLGALPKEPGRSAPVDRSEVGRVLQVMELGGVRHRPAGNLSHGEKQWLEIGMVLLTKPTLLLLDEPTSGMTQAESRRTADLLHQLRAENAVEAVIVVEHNIEFIKLVSDRVTVMHRGSVLADGTIEEVQDDKAVQDSYLGRLH
ncbi:MAG: ATP-binding cassette domain-containing protein [Acidimicrobiia bacterium]|nr:ATP-binding cassette domain-containing protein [Acidimicrobiia bacterium]